jgi:hypothetical protein
MQGQSCRWRSLGKRYLGIRCFGLLGRRGDLAGLFHPRGDKERAGDLDWSESMQKIHAPLPVANR